MDSLNTLPPGFQFDNGEDVYLHSLKTLPPNTVFRNKGNVGLYSIKTLPPDMGFRNEGDVHLESLVGGRFNRWSGNIEGIESKRLLNKMIADGLFDRR